MNRDTNTLRLIETTNGLPQHATRALRDVQTTHWMTTSAHTGAERLGPLGSRMESRR